MRRFKRFSLFFWALITLIVLAHLGYIFHFFGMEFIWDIIHAAGHFAGWAGLAAMALSLLYIARKKKWFTWGKVKFWYQWHVVLGMTGPLLIAFHAYGKYFGMGGLTLVCVWLVLLTGIIGHYLYRRLPEEVVDRAQSFRQRLGELSRLEEKIAGLSAEIDRIKTDCLDDGFLAEISPDQKYRMPRPLLARDFKNIMEVWRDHRRGTRQIDSLKWRLRDWRREERQAGLSRERELVELLVLQRDAKNLAALNEIFSVWRKVHVPLSWFMWWLAGLHLFAWIYY